MKPVSLWVALGMSLLLSTAVMAETGRNGMDPPPVRTGLHEPK
jgi:hypothetical protein